MAGPLLQHLNPGLDVPEHAQVGHTFYDAGVFRVLLHHLEIAHRHHVIVDVNFHLPPFTDRNVAWEAAWMLIRNSSLWG